MESRKFNHILCKKQAFLLFFYLKRKLKTLYSMIHFRFRFRFCFRSRISVKRLLINKLKKSEIGFSSPKPIRVASFNAALFAGAPVLPNTQFESIELINNYPKSILKSSPFRTPNQNVKSKLRVSINLPENEISLSRTWVPMRSPLCFNDRDSGMYGSQTVYDVLKEVDADVFALQDVKAEEGKGMMPLSGLAEALGMKYVFAESWAPEYGNAILSKWPIKRWCVHKILEDEDIRNVIKATIEVPWSGEVNVYCTQLDNLDENWRMKQIKAIMQSSDRPHILAGGLNSLERSDYASGRWMDIIKYYEEIGKPKPKAEVMKFLKIRGYEDAVDYAGDCEPVVIATKGQYVQGTCKYGTRVDYILTSPDSIYKFIPGSYTVISSKGTSDHHVVTVDLIKGDNRSSGKRVPSEGYFRSKEKVVRLGSPCSSRGVWPMER